MTTPPSTVSVLGLFTALVLGMLLLLGAFEVPVPTVSRSGTEAVGTDAAAERVAEEAAARIAELEAQLEASEADRSREARRAATALALLEEAGRARYGTIAGTVHDQGTEEPVANVQIFVRGTGIGGLTNERGRFLLLNVPAGDLEVVAQRIGFEEVGRVVSVEAGATTNVDIAMQVTSVEVGGVLVTEEGTAVGDGRASALIYDDGVRLSSGTALVDAIRAEDIDRVEITKDDAAVARFGEEAAAGVIEIFRKQARPESAQPALENASDGPVFTPFTVAPAILNRDEVVRAMREAYPRELRADGIGGTVHVWFFITQNGTVQDYRIRTGSGHDALDDAALRVADVYRFSPALNRDERVPVWVSLPITFLAVR
jgi:TonB family protein